MTTRRQRATLLLNPPQPVAEIDLHGFTKVEAIRRLTVFLEEVGRRQSTRRPNASIACWVLVITGSGAHSQYGPVLRTAVEALLQKRKMQYLPQRGKGGFTVNANSGIVFFEPSQPTDSKVLISHEPAASLSYASILAQHKDRVKAPPTTDMMRSEPLPFEVAATDSAIQQSRMDLQQEQGREQKEKHQLKKALSLSALELEQEQQEEAKLLEKALSLSMLEGASEPTKNENEEEEIQKALLASQKEEEEKRREQQREEELLLQRALSMSVLEKKEKRDEEEELLQKALSLSKMEGNHGGATAAADEDTKAALEASMRDFDASYFDRVPQQNDLRLDTDNATMLQGEACNI
ncbi:MAG: hypothetical protein SGBAC_006870 [Bacillariaceae sp.]